jgi:NAD+ diphosphatase
MREAPAMPIILASRTNIYAGSPLDRAGLQRDDADWIAARMADPESVFVIVWRSKTLITAADSPAGVFLTGAEARACQVAGGPWAFLGLRDGRAVFAVDISAAEDPATLVTSGMLGGETRFEDLRALAGRLPADDASVFAHARALMYWRSRHKFCGVCAGVCEPRSAGHALVCTQCGAQHFPRTDSAVIMLVHRGDRALLGHSQRFPNSTMYSTLAGFLEPGESLEEAVAREVLEEVGVTVGAVQYHSSQPWPFPSNIMLGFYAEGLSEEITLQEDELRDARWFSRAELRDPAAHGFQLPRIDSIARRLIEDWMEQG